MIAGIRRKDVSGSNAALTYCVVEHSECRTKNITNNNMKNIGKNPEKCLSPTILLM